MQSLHGTAQMACRKPQDAPICQADDDRLNVSTDSSIQAVYGHAMPNLIDHKCRISPTKKNDKAASIQTALIKCKGFIGSKRRKITDIFIVGGCGVVYHGNRLYVFLNSTARKKIVWNHVSKERRGSIANMKVPEKSQNNPVLEYH